MMMRRFRCIIVLMAAMILVANSSCSRDMFDLEKTQEYSDSLSPVDSLDPNHNWQLTDSKTITVVANANVNAQWLKILTADPRIETNAEVAAQIMISDGETVSLSFCYPKLITTFYAALIDDKGHFTVTPFTPADSEVDFSNPLYSQQVINYLPQPLALIYCYENELPDIINMDFDYNDVVMSVALERTGEREMRFHVALNAVGTVYPVSAVLHLKNIKYNDIDSVTTVGNASFNVNRKGDDIPNQLISDNMLKDKKPLLKSKNQEKEEDKEAVINLFCEAHWATGDLLTESYGQIERKRYNVNKGSGSDYLTMVPKEVTYIVAFKENVDLNHLTFDTLDPFIIKEYLGGTFEVHQYALRNDWVLWKYQIADIDKLPWALVIPYKKFRHPLEGVNIGFKKKNALGFGAYGTRGHSFGEWSMNQNLAQDWYLNEYATENQVY